MLIFKCQFSASDIEGLKAGMPKDGYCIFRRPGEKTYYGIIKAGLHSRFMDVLSGETLEHLEYLDEDEFRKLEYEGAEIIGNDSLLLKI